MNQIRIVIPIWGFTKAGGMRVLSQMANNWTANGIDTLVLCYYKSMPTYYPLDCKVMYIDQKGRFVERIDDEFGGRYSQAKKLIDMHKGMLIALNNLSNKYNVVIANFALSAFSVNKCAIKNKFYYIQAYEAWEGRKGFFGKIINSLVKRTYSLPLIRIVNADIYKSYKEIQSNYVVPPGLDLDTYHAREKYWKGERQFIIGCIGRTEVNKGSEDVAKAVEILQEKGLNIQFDVAFNPVNHGSFNLIKPDGDKNLAEFYRSVDVLVAPVRVQLGSVHYPVIEAMAVGTPVVSTGHYPATDENAYIVPIASPDKIAEVLEYMMNDYVSAITKANIARTEVQEFAWDKVSSKMIGIIEENLN